MKTSSTKHTTLVSFAAIVAFSAYGIVALCLLGTAGYAATIQKKDGQVLTGQILGRIAIKSTTAVVTQGGQQYTAVFYLVVDGFNIIKIDSKDVTIGPGVYNVLALSWSLSGAAMPPSDLDAVTKDSTIASPGGGPLVSGFFDSGAGWTQRIIGASVTGTVSALFAAAANLAGSTNIPALLAKPPTGAVLGEFFAFTDGGGSIGPRLNIIGSPGADFLPVSDLPSFPGPSISTSAGTFAIGGAAVGDRFPLGCANGPGCSPAKSGSQVLVVNLTLQGSSKGNVNDLLNTGAYVLAQDGSQAPVFAGGLDFGQYFAAFNPPVASRKFILYWPGNDLVDITSYLISGAPVISTGGIVPVYSTSNKIQPGSWVSIYGTGLASWTATWNGDFPTSLGGTSVTVNNKPAYLWFVSPTQINMQTPDDTTPGPANILVTTAMGSYGGVATLAPISPSFLLLDATHVAGIITRTDGSGAYGGGSYDIIGPTGTSLGFKTVAAKAGDMVAIYGVGFGPTNPEVPAGKAFSGAATTTNPVGIRIKSTSVTPGFAGLTGAGLYQMNITIPPGLGTGDVPLQAIVGGVQTQTFVVLALQ